MILFQNPLTYTTSTNKENTSFQIEEVMMEKEVGIP